MRIHSSLPCLTLFVLAACAADRGGANSQLAAPPADAALQSPAALSPKDSRTARAAAAEGLFQRQEWSAAAEAFEPLTREFPEDQRYWMRLGFARHSLGQYGASIAAFGQVQRGPALAHARYNIACGEALSGKPEAALEALESAVAAGFSDRATLAADQDLASCGNCRASRRCWRRSVPRRSSSRPRRSPGNSTSGSANGTWFRPRVQPRARAASSRSSGARL
ncbi:MAG: hypothetical protein IPK67_20485 [Planctomycetes bacterium]|nr:hypothetical protein [Planctomycetota bacterium]